MATSQAQQFKQAIQSTEAGIKDIQSNIKGTRDFISNISSKRKKAEQSVVKDSGNSRIKKVERKSDQYGEFFGVYGDEYTFGAPLSPTTETEKAVGDIYRYDQSLDRARNQLSQYQSTLTEFQDNLGGLQSQITSTFTDPSNRRARGRAATILTSPKGVLTEDTKVARRTLLGGSMNLG